MSDVFRGGLLLFAMLGALAVVPVLLRRLRPASLLALHALGLCAALAVALDVTMQRGDGRPLLGVYVVAVALIGIGGARGGGGPAPARAWRHAGFALPFVLLAGEMAVLLGVHAPGLVHGLVGAAALFAALASFALFRRALQRRATSQRGQDLASCLAALSGAIGLLLSLLPGGFERGLWPLVLGARGALASAARLPPYVVPSLRDWIASFLLALAVLVAVAATRRPFLAAEVAGAAFLLSLSVGALTRPLWVGAQRGLRTTARRAPDDVQPPSVALEAFGIMSPLLDDPLLRRPPRPSVVTRVPARRLLEAALERARQGQSSALKKKGRLAVDIREDEGDVDVEGDPVDLAEALCAVLDNALGLRERHPEVEIHIHVRGGAAQVTFEISDDLARHVAPGEAAPDLDSEHPFHSASIDVARRPGLGLGLARARFLVERQGGKLLTRKTPQGSCVQVTLPRRQGRSQVGIA